MNLQCPHCGTAVAITGVQAGAQVRCGACTQVFLIPQHQPVQQPIQQIPIASHASHQQSINPNLTQCKDCSGTVSSQAATCPHCGTPNPSGRMGVLVIKRQQRSFVGALGTIDIAINESPIGKIKNGGVMKKNVAPGKHQLGIGNHGRYRNFEIAINPNTETIVEFIVTVDNCKILSITNR